jgi:FkbM family methyltransferase
MINRLRFKRTEPLFVKDVIRNHGRKILNNSKSQIFQDLFVLNELGFKRNGYFVDIGASDGKTLSNTFLLEKDYSWKGILVEPNKYWHQFLERNRTSIISTFALYSSSNLEMEFINSIYPELSHIQTTANQINVNREMFSESYLVKTISLEDLLDSFVSPLIIDYLSIDIEGLEYEVLSQISLSKYHFNVITCEHNNNLESKNKLDSLFLSNGFDIKFPEDSKFDSWYVNQIIR